MPQRCDMLIDIACAWLSVALLCWSAVARPTRAECAPGWDLRTGIRRNGCFTCWQHPVAPRGWDAGRFGPIADWDGTFGRPERSVQPAGVLEGRIWCGTGAIPIVVLAWRDRDARRVGCGR